MDDQKQVSLKRHSFHKTPSGAHPSVLKGGIPRSPTAGDFALTRGVTLTANAPMVSTPILFAKNAKGGARRFAQDEEFKSPISPA